MKKLYYLIILTVILGLVLTGCFLSNVGQVPATSQTKVKPTGNPGAQTYAWHLSGDVMPVPPYGGSGDLPGSDTASKLIVNQPNGAVEVTITGVMNDLNPRTTYRVFLSNAYPACIDTEWSVTGSWALEFYSTLWSGGNPYEHDMIVTDGTATGGTPAGDHSSYDNFWEATVSIEGDGVTIVATYQEGSKVALPYSFTAIGTIVSGGTISGTWHDTIDDSGEWNGSAGYPGLFTATIPVFTFTTDDSGSGSWHVNLRNSDFLGGPGIYTLSVWINNATILISDNFDVTVD